MLKMKNKRNCKLICCPNCSNMASRCCKMHKLWNNSKKMKENSTKLRKKRSRRRNKRKKKKKNKKKLKLKWFLRMVNILSKKLK